MKKQLLYGSFFLSIIVIFACRNTVEKEGIYAFIDALEELKKIDSLRKFDTIGISNSGLKIISSKIKDKGILSVTYKNVSEKDISAIRCKAYCENAMLEPAIVEANVGKAGNWRYMGILVFANDRGLKKGDESTIEVKLRSWKSDGKSDAKHVRLVWPTKIVFSDMSEWNSKDYE